MDSVPGHIIYKNFQSSKRVKISNILFLCFSYRLPIEDEHGERMNATVVQPITLKPQNIREMVDFSGKKIGTIGK
jgi:hypothetical protein